MPLLSVYGASSVYLRAILIAQPVLVHSRLATNLVCRALHGLQSSNLSLQQDSLRAIRQDNGGCEPTFGERTLKAAGRTRLAATSYGEDVLLSASDLNTGSAKSTEHVTKLLQQAVARRNVKQAVQLYQDLLAKGGRPSLDTSDALLKVLCKASWFAPAWSVYQRLQAESSVLQYSTYQAMLTTAIQAGEPYTALEVLRDLQASSLQPNILTYCAVISALGKQRRRGMPFAKLAYELWQELRQSGLPLDAAAYRTGMNACIGATKPGEARQLLADMQAAGIQPDVRAFNILLKGFARSGEVNALPALLAQMKGAAVARSGVTYNTLIDAYVRAGWLDEARATLDEAQEAGVALDVWSYSTLIKGYVQQGSVRLAWDVMEEMRQRGITPNEVSYTTLIDGCVRRGEVGQGEQLLVDMQARGVRPNVVTYNTLLKGYAQDESKTIEEALAVLREMGGVGVMPTVDTFNTLMEACVRRANVPAVLRLFRKILQCGYTPDAVSYTTLIMAFASADRTDDAVRAFHEMRADPRVTVDAAAWNAIIDALARVGRMSEADALLTELMLEARQRGWEAPVEAFTSVIQGYARLWQVEPALQVLQAFYEQGGTPDAQMFDSLIDLCVRTGSYKRALQVVRAMERFGWQVDKERIRRLLDEAHRQESAQRRRQGLTRVRNENLERFKFWLGLPNTYYSSD